MSEKHAIIVVTGVQAAGKSTVARMLARRFERGVHVEADALQSMIMTGGVQVETPGPPAGEAARQLELRLKHLCLLGRSFVAAGFTAVLDDIILGERWTQMQTFLAGIPFALVVLAPRVEVVVNQRDNSRKKAPLGAEWASYLDEALRSTMAGFGLWVDSSAQSAQETVEEIMHRLWLRDRAAPLHLGAEAAAFSASRTE